MKVFVAGATGRTGLRIVQELVKQDISVKALVRNLETAREILPPEAELIVGDVLDYKGLHDAIGDSTVVICATGAKPDFDFTGPYKVDYLGTKNLVDVSKQKGIERFVLVSSLCVSKFFHPLNLFWLVLFWKKQAEKYIEKSGINYTIVRPGGLKNDDDQLPIVMESSDRLFEGSIPRIKVGQVCVEAMFQPAASNKIVEIVTQAKAPGKSLAELFISVS
ncbi:NAD(P)H-binding protein [Okeania sp.]|uniref:NAD(P)H-binding protein n=1 Tax=Okeania sp. TaxID=3100323 RepID=UPI002B4B53A5|nr:NAD(P)H-binding protein [Okeania sp.]MEB3340992.1 NAD(P)H-binding protein [Okeania sp.]